MNTPVEMLIAALKIAKSNGSSETAVKESLKQIVKNQNFSTFHERNLISIIEISKTPNEMFYDVISYLQTFN